MEKYEHSQLQARQQTQLLNAFELLKNEAVFSPRMAKKDADDLRKLIHMLRALSWISPNERNYYLRMIDEIVEDSAARHDDTIYGAIRQSVEK